MIQQLPLIAALALAAGTLPSDGALTVADLRCEYLSEPLGIDTPKPRFGWKLVAPEQPRGQKQTACRIVVRNRTSGELLWDSGKMDSCASVNVSYDGPSLASNLDCTWQVQVWDKDGKPSDWSPPARFSMGLLEPADWDGEWIHHKDAAETMHIWYRKNFSLEEIPAVAFAHVCSIGYHELYVNGRRADTAVLSPAVTNLEKRALYITYDITGHLQPGANVIAVWTGPGWARADGSYGKGVWKQDPILKCQVDFSNGMMLHSDSSWKCQISSSENLGPWKGGGQGEYGGERIDARRHVPDWNQPSYDDSGWPSAAIARKEVILSAAMLEPDRKVETLKPISITERDGMFTFDMGRNFTGWLEFDLRNGNAGEVVRFMTANRAGEIMDFNQQSEYIHDDSGAGAFSHRFNYMAGRWITVAGLTYKPALDDLRCHIITNDRRRTGAFKCSNELFNRIYETDLMTYIANTVNGVTMDCPHRERYGYGEVALACAWGCGIPNYESAAFHRKLARDWFDVQREDGFVNTIAPQIYSGAGGTLWSSAPLTVSWEFHKAYGDMQHLAAAYPAMKKWVDFLHRSVSEDGILEPYDRVSRFLGDWATPHGNEYGNTPEARLFNNAVYAYCLEVMVRAAALLGTDDDARIFSARLEELRKNAHRSFFNEEEGNYIDGRQLAMAFPLFTRITPEHLRERVMERFVEEISVRKPYLDTGSSGLPVLLQFLVEDAERADLLFAALNRIEHPGYGYFFEKGETLWPEYWQIEGHDSRIHTCYTGIAGYFIKAIGGIRPDPSAWGMKRFLIKPQLVGDLTSASATSGTLYGPIVSNWTRSGTSGAFEIGVPPNTTATVFLPAADSQHLKEGGMPVTEATGVRFLRMEAGCAVLELDSGSYHFTSRLP